MYVSLDRSAGRFLHKHENFDVVCNLDFIVSGGSGAHIDVTPIDHVLNALAHWTDMECALLYRNTTGEPQSQFIGITLRAALQELADRLPVTDAIPSEAEAQAAYVEKHLEAHEMQDIGDPPDSYVYVKESSTPGRKPDLWNGALRVTVPADELGNAARKHIARAQQRVHQQAAVTHTPANPAQPSARKAPARSLSRPRSGVCKAIWETLDAERAATGEVPSRARIKELAKQNGWNPNTASVQSAAWRKQNGLA